MGNARLDESQAEIKIVRKHINNLRHGDNTTLMTESEEELKSLLMRMKEESENADLKVNIQKTKIMAFSSITSLQIEGKKWKLRNFIFLGSKITVDCYCSHEIKKNACSLEENDRPRQHLKKQRHYFADKGLSSQSYVFSSSHVWM